MKSGAFLPMTTLELNARGWDELDVLLLSGDDYFDSPTHGVAVIGRVLEDAGYRVAIIARPDWTRPESLKALGTPGLFVGISAGAVDSTLNNYTADLAPRKDDVYASASSATRRPNFATAVYCGAAKSAFPNTPIVLGGVEASTRRFAYFDYLKKKIRRSVLVDTRADLLVFGSGEKTVLEIANRLAQNQSIDHIDGTAQLVRDIPDQGIELPSFDAISADASQLVLQTQLLEAGLGPHKSNTFYQRYQEGVVQSHPPRLMTEAELDKIHGLPFLRTSHPRYLKKGMPEIPASIPVRWSVIAQRGCPGGCSFCALGYHQGRQVISRSEKGIIEELNRLSHDTDFKGTITDIGGPTANAYGLAYKDTTRCQKCRRSSCLFPVICSNLDVSQQRFVHLLKTARTLTGIKHIFIASGIRHDLALRNRSLIKLIAQSFTGGHLKVAPEHTSETVLKQMRKPGIQLLEEFERIFQAEGREKGLEQYLVPYFIAGFPGCTRDAADSTARWLTRRHQKLQQVQNFIPLPGTMASAIYAAGIDETGNPVYIPDAAERKRQKALLLGTERPRLNRNSARREQRDVLPGHSRQHRKGRGKKTRK
ncbi:MAG: YgiQ family radical SAM protein [Deltaproteobacteria bacterium]|nr:YgiQ family radical SAM protein [Deltaproteobacteria bacterium]